MIQQAALGDIVSDLDKHVQDTALPLDNLIAIDTESGTPGVDGVGMGAQAQLFMLARLRKDG